MRSMTYPKAKGNGDKDSTAGEGCGSECLPMSEFHPKYVSFEADAGPPSKALWAQKEPSGPLP